MSKKIALVALCVLASFTGGFLAQALNGSAFAKDGNQDTLRVRAIECEEISVKHPKGERSVFLRGTEFHAGLWVTGEEGRTIAMVDIGDYAAVGLYQDARKSNENGFDVSLAVNSSGAWIQEPSKKSIPAADLRRGTDSRVRRVSP